MRALSIKQKPRRIQYNLMEKVEVKLEELMKQDIIKKNFLRMNLLAHGSVRS